MKTPDEIKKGLECCGGDCFNGNEECPYDKDDLKENISCIRWMSKDALAYIQQLEAQVPKWISVEERLPDCRVLAINDRGVVAVGKIGQFYDRGENVYVCDEWDSNIGIIHVTHWMPLPSTEGLHDD